MNVSKKAQEACFYHPDVKAYGYCELCGLPICPSCINEITINNQRKIICKECLNNLVAAKRYKTKENAIEYGVIKERTFLGFRINIGTLIGLLIELLILGLISKSIVEIALSKNISGWQDIGNIIVVLILAFIFWTIFIYGLKKVRRKIPKIIEKVE